MAKIHINTENAVRKFKPVHGVGQPPTGGLGRNFFQSFHYLTAIGSPYSRLHDVKGAFGGCRFVDIPNVFRNFDADENDPASYDFTFTDALITALIEAGVEPYYRLGISIENQAIIKPYHTAPPKDYDKWARICEHIIAHYIEGWADGFNYKITYWEIWNEPDGVDFPERDIVAGNFSGTPEEYYRLYDVAAKHLKARFPDIKIGGYAAIGFQHVTDNEEERKLWVDMTAVWIEYFHGFMKYIKEQGSPLDFFSFHCYREAKKLAKEAAYAREQLDAYGYESAELHLNEWNPLDAGMGKLNTRATARHGAQVSAILTVMQQGVVDVGAIYDARMDQGMYNAFFDPVDSHPAHAYYSFAAFNKLYELKTEVETSSDTEELYVLAASDGTRHKAIITNVSGEAQELEITGADLSSARYRIIDKHRLLSLIEPVRTIPADAVLLIEW